MNRDNVVERIANKIGKKTKLLVIGEKSIQFCYKKERYRVSIGHFGQWVEHQQAVGFAPDKKSKKLAKKLGFKK